HVNLVPEGFIGGADGEGEGSAGEFRVYRAEALARAVQRVDGCGEGGGLEGDAGGDALGAGRAGSPFVADRGAVGVPLHSRILHAADGGEQERARLVGGFAIAGRQHQGGEVARRLRHLHQPARHLHALPAQEADHHLRGGRIGGEDRLVRAVGLPVYRAGRFGLVEELVVVARGRG